MRDISRVCFLALKIDIQEKAADQEKTRTVTYELELAKRYSGQDVSFFTLKILLSYTYTNAMHSHIHVEGDMIRGWVYIYIGGI